MAVFSNVVKLALLAAVTVQAMPTKTNHLMPRTTLAYNEIVGFPQTVPDDTEGDLYTAYQPYLYVINGCVPFPAVDAEGDIRYVPTTLDAYLTNRCKVADFQSLDSMAILTVPPLPVKSTAELPPTVTTTPSCMPGSCPKMNRPGISATSMTGKA